MLGGGGGRAKSGSLDHNPAEAVEKINKKQMVACQLATVKNGFFADIYPR